MAQVKENKRDNDKPVFAFLIHPRVSIRDDLAMAVHPLCRYLPLPDKWLEGILRFFPPIVSGRIYLDNEKKGYIIFIPLLAEKMLRSARGLGSKKVIAAVKLAEKRNCKMVGLGMFTASITLGGQTLIKDDWSLGITNGNSLTAGITAEAVDIILDKVGLLPNNTRIGILGATGSVGSGVAEYLADKGYDLLLVGRKINNQNDYHSNPKLRRLMKSLANYGNKAQASVDINDLKSCNFVIVTTSQAQALIDRHHLTVGTIVYDDTQPRNTSVKLASSKEILVIDGGLLTAPGLNITVNIDLPKEHAYACLVEAALLVENNAFEHYSIGQTNLDQIKEMIKYLRQSDYYIAEFRSFGNLIPASRWQAFSELVQKKTSS